MTTTTEKLKYLNGTKEAIKDALTEKGVDMSGDIPFREYADKIRELGPTDDLYYGIEFNTTTSSPDCTRIGNMNLNRSLPIHNRIRGCLLDDNGNVIEYLNQNDWTGHTRDGSKGQVMVELPEYYRKFETDGDVRRVKVSEYPLPGYHLVKKKYIGAYEAALQHSTSKLCSVVNFTVDYRGGDNNNAGYDGTYRSFLGRPHANSSREVYRTYARNRNPNTTNWNIIPFTACGDLYWLYAVEYATLDTQKPVSYTKDGNGFAQGGLGIGVTEWDFNGWHGFNYNTSFIPCGWTDNLGNGSGEVVYDVKDSKGAIIRTFMVPRYRGIENLFGHLWKWVDGYIGFFSQTPDGDFYDIYITENPDLFNFSDTSGYRHVAKIPYYDGGFIDSIVFGEEGLIIPVTTNGSSTTYFCDASLLGPVDDIPHAIAMGGSTLNAGGECGLINQLASNNGDGHDNSVGTRLCYIPN